MRYVILILLFFSSLSFSQQPPAPQCTAQVGAPDACGFNPSVGGPILSERTAACTNAGNILVSDGACGSSTHAPGSPKFKCYASCACPSGFRLNTTISPEGYKISGCVPDGPTPGEDECTPPQVKNIETGSCEPKTECTYPLLYDFYSNACMPNPNNCAIGAKPNPLNPGTCMATEPTSCPAGWALSADSLNCSPSGSGSSDAANSSTPSNASSAATTSTPSNTSSAATASSASNTSGTNTSSGSGGGTGGGSGGDNGGGTGNNSSSGSNNSWTPHSGYGNWIPISANSPCPNKYQDANGQWWCSAANTGTASSAAGQCDPTAKDYLACISQTAGNASSSGSNSSACNPASADYQQCQAASQAGTKMKELGDKFKEDTDKELEKFKKAVDDDLSNFQRDGLTFKDEPSRLRSLLTSLLPVSTACNPPPMKIFGRTYNLDCVYFNLLKQALGWCLAILTVFNIWQLATRPVNR